jgi:DNA-binding response OmpR family regulator
VCHTPPEMNRILLVEDDPTIAETLRYTLAQSGFEVITAADGLAALARAREAPPDLVVLDLMLPALDGFEVCRRLRQTRPDLAIIVVTALDDDASLLRGFEAGADDYVTKPFKTKELLARVGANLRRRREEAPPESVRAEDLTLDLRAHEVTVAGSPVALRPKEFAVLLLLASNPGALLTRQRISAEVWGYDHVVSSRTIDTHILNIRKKVEPASAFTFIETAHGLGYRFAPRRKTDA